jgi:cell wall-associated NlpC family hydrolase
MAFEWTEKRVDQALARLRQFEGLPHRHRRCDPAVGVDCVHLVITALEAAGAVPRGFVVPGYARSAGYMARRNTAADHFVDNFWTTEVGADEIRDGDVVFFRVNRSSNHLGICMGRQIWHSLWSSGVTVDEVEDVRDRVETVLRINRAGTKEPRA